jgi:hypothetical protein
MTAKNLDLGTFSLKGKLTRGKSLEKSVRDFRTVKSPGIIFVGLSDFCGIFPDFSDFFAQNKTIFSEVYEA